MYSKIDKVKVEDIRDKIYTPPHKRWIQLTKMDSSEIGSLKYEVLRLEWKDEFEDVSFIENNFDLLFVKPKQIIYEQPVQTEDEFYEFN
jgi:hypothetical protein